MFDGRDQSKVGLIWNFNKLTQVQKSNWVSEAFHIVKQNRDTQLVGYAVGLISTLEGGVEKLYYLLQNDPDKSKNIWNEIIIFALVENRFERLSNEELLVDQVLKTFRYEMTRFQFLMRYIYLNKEYALSGLCDLIVNHAYGTSKALENYGSYIYSTLNRVDEMLPAKLIECARKGGVDISNLSDYT